MSENCAWDNPGYSSVSETKIDRNMKNCGNVIDASNFTLENEEKLEGIPFTTASSEYAKENMDTKLKYRNENSCDNSPDHYASSVPDIYDVLHGKRQKMDNGEKFDRMIELKSSSENRNESIERNKSIEHQDSTMLNCHASRLEKSKPGGYESVVIEGDVPVLSSEGNGPVHGDIEIVRQHNKEYLQNQKEEEVKLNKSSISRLPGEYVQVNESTKLKNKKKHNDTDPQTVCANAETHKGKPDKCEERPDKKDRNAGHFGISKNIK
ncbi:unnamed protein product [Mytilus coruscus]|uniref:Uncharacterized protein n=1 Tax=Mytilus coruscus TaxID=42192 RepID=A0A6J7ZXL4_MYTCO|nr:unnamed protein product [Mytilus coruscus]